MKSHHFLIIFLIGLFGFWLFHENQKKQSLQKDILLSLRKESQDIELKLALKRVVKLEVEQKMPTTQPEIFTSDTEKITLQGLQNENNLEKIRKSEFADRLEKIHFLLANPKRKHEGIELIKSELLERKTYRDQLEIEKTANYLSQLVALQFQMNGSDFDLLASAITNQNEEQVRYRMTQTLQLLIGNKNPKMIDEYSRRGIVFEHK